MRKISDTNCRYKRNLVFRITEENSNISFTDLRQRLKVVGAFLKKKKQIFQ